jgi:dTDP-4-dehydrorhamnose reductase
VFTDRIVSPTYTTDIARAVRQMLERRGASGLYHCVNSGAATWADVAREIADILGCAAVLDPITLETASLRAPRPKYCALSNAKLEAIGIVMPSWQDALRRHIHEEGRS